MRGDLGFALRGLRRSPGFAAAAVLCLALGIGANTAVWSVLDAVLLSPLPFAAPERLVLVWGRQPAEEMEEMPASGAEFLDYRDQARSLTGIAALINRYVNLTGDGAPERVAAARVSASLFPLLGVEAALGRTFLPEEDRLGNEKVAVLAHDLWRRRYGGDPGVVGRKILVSDEPFTVVGVMPADFRFKVGMFEHELWVPVAINEEKLPPRGFRGLTVVGRLAPGTTLKRAQAEMDVLAASFRRDFPDVYPPDSGFGIRLTPLHEQLVGDLRPALGVLMATVALVLLIACANVANLLLARATARQKEVAIRAALGASRGGLLRQFLTESVVLALLGGAVGLLLAGIGIRALVAAAPGLPRLGEVRIDAGVLAFTLAVSLSTGLLFGLAPALRAFRHDVQATLKEGGKTSGGGGAGRHRLRSALVVAEVAVALVVLVGAGLLGRSLLRLAALDLGFDAGEVLTLQVYVSPTKYADGAQQTAHVERLLAELGRLPGVRHAGAVTGLPLSEVQFLVETAVEGHPSEEGRAEPLFDWRPIAGDYFGAMGIPLARGRAFDSRDHAGASPVAIVDETLAARYWPGRDPLGRRLMLTTGQPGNVLVWRTVVGVAGHVRALALEGESREQVYTPLAQSPSPYVSLALRTRGDPLRLAAAARQAVWAVDPDQPVDRVQAMAEIVAAAGAGRRSFTALLAAFAAVALALATVGVYGVMAYSVAQRRHEIGIRMAMGARPADVLRLVARQGLRLVASGLALGAALSLAAGRWVASVLYGVDARDPLTLAAVALFLGGVVLLASFVPARRAARVDPVTSLRS